MFTPQTIAICGDWHGNTKWATTAVEKAINAGADIIVHLGDFGFDVRDPQYLIELETVLDEYNVDLWWVDGNHEHFDALYTLPLDDDGRRPITHHISHLPRGYRWEWNNTTWMALGGAASVNRGFLESGVDWFPQEYITLDDVEYASRPGIVDVMVTHDAPLNVPSLNHGKNRFTQMWSDKDLELSRDNQLFMEDVILWKTPNVLFHGHHHFRYTDQFNSTVIQGVEGDGVSFRNNIVLVNTQGEVIDEESITEE